MIRRDNGYSTLEVLIAMIGASIILVAALSGYIAIEKDQAISAATANEATSIASIQNNLLSNIGNATALSLNPVSGCTSHALVTTDNNNSFDSIYYFQNQIISEDCSGGNLQILATGVTSIVSVSLLDTSNHALNQAKVGYVSAANVGAVQLRYTMSGSSDIVTDVIQVTSNISA